MLESIVLYAVYIAMFAVIAYFLLGKWPSG